MLVAGVWALLQFVKVSQLLPELRQEDSLII